MRKMKVHQKAIFTRFLVEKKGLCTMIISESGVVRGDLVLKDYIKIFIQRFFQKIHYCMKN